MASREEIDALRAVLEGLSESDIVKVLGVDGLQAVISYIRNAPATDEADGVLVTDGGRLRRMSFVTLASILYRTYFFEISATPSDAKVVINGEERSGMEMMYGGTVEWEVSAEHYVTQSGSAIVTEDTRLDVALALEQFTFEINATPSDAKVIINGEERTSITADYGTEIEWEVSCDGYVSKSGTAVITEDMAMDVALTALYTFTINATPSDAKVVINGEERDSITVEDGAEIEWEVSAEHYVSQSGTAIVTSDETITVALALQQFTFGVNATPSDANVVINGSERDSITADYGTAIEWEVSADHYVSQSGSVILTEDMAIEVTLALQQYTFVINPTPSDATVVINGEEGTSITAEYGTEVEWEVSCNGYETQSGSQVVSENTTIEVELVELPFTFVYDNNSMYIYSGTVAPSSSTDCLFAISGAYDIEINGVLIEDISSSTTFGSDYLNASGNVIKIWTHEGTTINHRLATYTSGSTYNQTRFISEITTWGCATFGIVSYMFAMSSSDASTLTKVPAFTKGFAAVTSFEGMFYYCNSITELADGLFDAVINVTNFYGCFYLCSGLTSLPENLFASHTAITQLSYCFNMCENLEGESAYDLVDIDGVPTKIHLYERKNYSSRYTAPTSTTRCYYNCTGLDDYGSIPSGWK